MAIKFSRCRHHLQYEKRANMKTNFPPPRSGSPSRSLIYEVITCGQEALIAGFTNTSFHSPLRPLRRRIIFSARIKSKHRMAHGHLAATSKKWAIVWKKNQRLGKFLENFFFWSQIFVVDEVEKKQLWWIYARKLCPRETSMKRWSKFGRKTSWLHTKVPQVVRTNQSCETFDRAASGFFLIASARLIRQLLITSLPKDDKCETSFCSAQSYSLAFTVDTTTRAFNQ